MRETGTVQWFNASKGFGFISPSDGSDDVFVHFSSVEMDGYKTLADGSFVEFERKMTEKGYAAQNVRVIVATEGAA